MIKHHVSSTNHDNISLLAFKFYSKHSEHVHTLNYYFLTSQHTIKQFFATFQNQSYSRKDKILFA